jgi:Cyclic nucleotide-binding domain/Transmembrane secretion effector
MEAGSTARPRSKAGVFATAFRNRSLLLVEVAWLAFNGAEWGVWLTLMVWAYTHGGAAAASLIVLVQLVPCIFISPYLGAITDRARAGRVLFVGLLITGLTMAGLGVAMALGAPRVLVFVLAPIMNLALSIPRPAQAALLPSVVRTPLELTAANVVSSWMENASVLIAPALTGVLLGLGGPALATGVLAACTLAGAFMVVGIPGPRPPNEPGEGTSLMAEVRESVAAVWRVPAVRTLVGVVGSQYILVGALDVLYVVMAITTLGLGESGAGYLNSAFGAGGLLGVAVTATLVARRRLAPALIAGILTAAVALGVLGIFPMVIGAFALLTVAGLSRTVFDVTGRILLQRAAPPQVLGQVFALLESLMDAGLAFGAILVPVLVGLSGARAALVGTALLFFVLVAMAWRRLRTIDDAADVPQVEIQLLRSIPIFSPLPAPELEGLPRALVPVEAPAGATLITEGEPGDCFYAIADGRVSVTKLGQDVATLGRGDGFGEIALIQDVPRTATVVALTDVSLYSLEQEPFVLALTGHAPAARAADDLVAQRLEELKAI